MWAGASISDGIQADKLLLAALEASFQRDGPQGLPSSRVHTKELLLTAAATASLMPQLCA